ncbi:hypothetical protein EI94DRAFT_622802 [Lactarius quietus]|nr:hypothetical protein EI94DRAFT_622802 [Lactarius quietus]
MLVGSFYRCICETADAVKLPRTDPIHVSFVLSHFFSYTVLLVVTVFITSPSSARVRTRDDRKFKYTRHDRRQSSLAFPSWAREFRSLFRSLHLVVVPFVFTFAMLFQCVSSRRKPEVILL